jgi:hypothetical protein
MAAMGEAGVEIVLAAKAGEPSEVEYEAPTACVSEENKGENEEGIVGI